MALWFELKVNLEIIKVVEIVRERPARPRQGELCTYRWAIWDGLVQKVAGEPDELSPSYRFPEAQGRLDFPYGDGQALPLVAQVLAAAGHHQTVPYPPTPRPEADEYMTPSEGREFRYKFVNPYTLRLIDEVAADGSQVTLSSGRTFCHYRNQGAWRLVEPTPPEV